MASQLPAVASGNLGAATGWEDRLREAAYTSPSGTRIKFFYEAVARETDKRTAGFEFPGVDDAYVQDNGFGARRYPLRCIFWGNQCDLIATAFEAALLERGPGRLEHPLYGSFDVVPFGTITRRDDLKDAANQAIVEVTFWTSTGAVYPSDKASPRNEILVAIEGFDAAAASQFADQTDLRTAPSRENVRATVRDFLRQTSAIMTAASSSVSAVRRQVADQQSTVNLALDVLVGQPLQLAQQITNLVRAPARAAEGIKSRLDAYGRLAEKILGSPQASGAHSASILPRMKRRALNDVHVSDLFAMSAVAGSVQAVIDNQFATKPEALRAAEQVIAQLDAVVTWREAVFGASAQIDHGGSYQALRHAVSLVAGYLVQTSFVLLPERRIVLDRPRTIIDLCAELYGSVDDRLDFLIDSNGLSGSEILELPRGRSIVYYV